MNRFQDLLMVVMLLLCWPIVALAEAGEEIATLKRLAADVSSVQSDFVQEKHLAIFKEVMVSKGRFTYGKPDRLRWELTEPVAAGFVLNGSKGRRWNARSGEQSFELAREPAMKLISEQIFAWTSADFDRLRRSYQLAVVQDAPIILRLEPLGGAGDFLDHLQVSFSADGRHLTTIEIHEQGGDFTLIRFHNTVLNASLDDRLF